MKVTLVKSCKFGKPGECVEVSRADGISAISDGIARHPSLGEITANRGKSVGELRKERGLCSVDDLARKHAAALAADAANAAKLKAKGNKFDPLKLEQIQQRNDRAKAGLCVV